MSILRLHKRSKTIAATATIFLAVSPATFASAQSEQTESQQTDKSGQQISDDAGRQTGQQAEADGKSDDGQGQQTRASENDDGIVATVGEREIRRSEVLEVVGMLPPQLQQQQPEMLIPIALDQLIMRELILQEAKEDGLEKDPAVTSLAENESGRATEDAMVRTWLNKELGEAVTDEKVQQTYDDVAEQMGDEAPAMADLRPQIEQELRQQAFLDLSRDLQADADVTLYGPDGKPITQ